MGQYNDLASIYDDLINSDVDYKAWSVKILELCEELNIEKRDYLDLACGTGNMTALLAKEFRTVWAVDLSSSMLTEAENKLRNAGVKAKLVCQDITSLNLKHSFDLISCCLDGTNYILEEECLESYFNRVYIHLKENGAFIFDINSYYKLTEVLGNNTYSYDSNDVVYIWENYLDEDIVDMKLIFFVKDVDNYRRFDEVHQERAYKDKYLESLFKKIGFNVYRKLNNYETEDINEECERITYVLTKRAKENSYGR